MVNNNRAYERMVNQQRAYELMVNQQSSLWTHGKSTTKLM